MAEPGLPAPGLSPEDALAALRRAGDDGAAGLAALAYLAARGIPGARLWLRAGEHWSLLAPTGSPDSPLDADPIAEGLARARGGDSVTVEIPGSGGTERWELIPVPGKTTAQGVFALPAESATPARNELPAAAALLGLKWAELRARRDLERERDRNAGWFKTLDGQIRILERERQKLAVLLNRTDVAIFVSDPDGTIEWVNPVMSRRYPGKDGNGLVGRTCRTWCGRDQGCADCPVRSVRDGLPVVHNEREEERGDGTRQLYVSAFPVRSPEGKVNSVLTMIQDITDLETLRRSQARYQLLFERSADAMVMARSDDLTVLMANRQARKLFGLNLEGEERADLLGLHPPQMRTGMEAHYTRLKRGRPLDNLEVEVVAADGGHRTVNACATLFDLDGSEAILVEFRDVTHLRELQEELARADHLITLGTMNAGIAHEFKNRLAPLRAFAQLLTKETDHLPRILAHAPLMVQEVDRLTALVRDVLDYARPQEPAPLAEDLGDLAGELVAEFRTDFGDVLDREGIRCETRVGTGRTPVWMDASQLRRAFLNLFKNAIEALEGWDGDKSLTVEVRHGDGTAVLVLTDTGPGIDSPTLARIFDPFYTTKGPRGTGLGMCITRSLIEANGGTVEVTSAPGRGTEVRLCFPMAGQGLAPSSAEAGSSGRGRDGRRAA